MATHSSILVWKIPWAEEPGGLQSMGSQSQARPSMHTHGNESGWQALPMGWAAHREVWVHQTCCEDSFSACDAAPKCGVMVAFVK